jgi:type III secretion system FlhB-like substrate exporter
MRDDTSKKAVAVKYIDSLPAPFVSAKGKGEVALAIERIARAHGVNIVPNPELAESLIDIDIASFIPEMYYEIIAELLVFVRKLKGEV